MRHTTIIAAARELRRGKYISKFPKIQHLAPKKITSAKTHGIIPLACGAPPPTGWTRPAYGMAAK